MADRAANGPEIDGETALVDNLGVTTALIRGARAATVEMTAVVNRIVDYGRMRRTGGSLRN